MSVGSNIKKYRMEARLTQKDLADKLHITYQALSKWENDETEPSIGMITNLCAIFHCTADDLLGVETKPEESEMKEEPKVVEKVVVEQAKPMLALCQVCNKPIYESNEIHRVDNYIHHHQGRHNTTETVTTLMCQSCFDKHFEEEKANAERAERERRASLKKRRIISLVVAALVFVIFLAIGIVNLANGKTDIGVECIVLSIILGCLVGTLILNNTFITEMWMEIASWGFVKLPGVIFDLSFDGLIFLIVVKVLFFILGLVLAIASVLFASVFAGLLSVFVYPYAIYKNVEGKENN